MRIIVNGEELDWPSEKIGYYDIRAMSDENDPTITVRFPDKTYRELDRGEVIKAEDGMVINAVNTGRA